MAIRWRRRLLLLCLFKLVIAKTWIEAFVVPGSTPHLFLPDGGFLSIDAVVNFDPNDLCLESPEFGSVPLVLHSSGHLLLSLVNPSNTLDQFTVMIDFQSSSLSICPGFQKRDDQTTNWCSREIRSLTNELN